MGLDITAYSYLRHIGLHEKDPDLNGGETDGWYCYRDGHHTAFAYKGFEASFRDIPILGQDDTFIYGGCYEDTENTDEHSFRAGSYGGYNQWRDDLRVQFNPEVKPELPFYELIYFADNEGTIGPKACRDLAYDFNTNREAYFALTGTGYDGRYDQELYDRWTVAMMLGESDGLVRFC